MQTVMETTIHQADLHTIGQQLQNFFGDLPIRVHCAVRDERLIVLGQHPESAGLDPSDLLKVLERKIQTLHLTFTQQVRLYLRVLGHRQPYAHRWFMIQPPPPPPLRLKAPVQGPHSREGWVAESVSRSPQALTDSVEPSESEEEPWIVGDEELDALVRQLTASTLSWDPLREPLAIAPTGSQSAPETAAIGSPTHFIDGTEPIDGTGAHQLVPSITASDPIRPEESTSLTEVRSLFRSPSESIQPQPQPLSQSLYRHVLAPVSAYIERSPLSVLSRVDKPLAIAAGMTALGLAGAGYSLTRPCVLGACSELDTAQNLGEKSAQILQQAESWNDLEVASTHLQQAVERLEPIPIWSSYSQEANRQIEHYAAQLATVETLLDMEAIANRARQTGQGDIHSLEDWKTVRSLWQTAIPALEAIPSDHDLYAFARKNLSTYRVHLTRVEQSIDREEQALQSLDAAKQAAKLAQARQGAAQSLENWQFARVTWMVALDRLQQVPDNTLAGVEAQRLTDGYQTALSMASRRAEHEREAVRLIEQAEQQAQVAQLAEQRLDWQRAVTNWDGAIATLQQFESGTSYQLKAETLLSEYGESLTIAQEKRQMSDRIRTELETTCIGEIRICNLLSVGQTIKVRLDQGYVGAINAARNSGNSQLQAVVTDHQLILRRALEQIANQYELTVEVYDPDNALLEQHLPQSE